MWNILRLDLIYLQFLHRNFNKITIILFFSDPQNNFSLRPSIHNNHISVLHILIKMPQSFTNLHIKRYKISFDFIGQDHNNFIEFLQIYKNYLLTLVICFFQVFLSYIILIFMIQA